MYKVLQKAVSCCLNVHLNCNHLSNVFQSSYKQFHSTETTLLKVHNDILLNIDTGKFTALTLLGLSAAFASLLGMAYRAQHLPGSAHS